LALHFLTKKCQILSFFRRSTLGRLSCHFDRLFVVKAGQAAGSQCLRLYYSFWSKLFFVSTNIFFMLRHDLSAWSDIYANDQFGSKFDVRPNFLFYFFKFDPEKIMEKDFRCNDFGTRRQFLFLLKETFSV